MLLFFLYVYIVSWDWVPRYTYPCTCGYTRHTAKGHSHRVVEIVEITRALVNIAVNISVLCIQEAIPIYNNNRALASPLATVTYNITNTEWHQDDDTVE